MTEFSITYNGSDITQYVVGYNRNHNICSGIGMLSVSIDKTCGTDFIPYGEVILSEDGYQKGKFYVATSGIIYPDLIKVITCQDGSKLLQDYFIDTQYDTKDDPYFTRYWIDKFLNETLGPVGKSYEFRVEGNGPYLSNNTTLGFNYTLDQVTQLLQQSGWFMWFDEDGVCVIDEINYDFDDYSKATYTDKKIIQIHTNKNDGMLRNRAVVRGAGSDTEEYIFAEATTLTPYNYDGSDYRTVVIENGNIKTREDALRLANQLLDETKKVTDVTVITIEGYTPRKIGETISVKSNYRDSKGLITTIVSEANQNGMTTTIYINERCPRLFGYYGPPDNPKVYIGTDKHGVWYKKLKDDHTWVDYSDGITNLHIDDLSIYNGKFACVASGELYTRDIADASWSKASITGFTDENGNTYPAASGVCVACAIDQAVGDIYALYNLRGKTFIYSGYLYKESDSRSWVTRITGTSGNYTTLVSISGSYDFAGYDLDIYQRYLYITVLGDRLDYIDFGVMRNNPHEFPTAYGSYTNAVNTAGQYNYLPDELEKTQEFNGLWIGYGKYGYHAGSSHVYKKDLRTDIDVGDLHFTNIDSSYVISYRILTENKVAVCYGNFAGTAVYLDIGDFSTGIITHTTVPSATTLLGFSATETKVCVVYKRVSSPNKYIEAIVYDTQSSSYSSAVEIINTTLAEIVVANIIPVSDSKVCMTLSMKTSILNNLTHYLACAVVDIYTLTSIRSTNVTYNDGTTRYNHAGNLDYCMSDFSTTYYAVKSMTSTKVGEEYIDDVLAFDFQTGAISILKQARGTDTQFFSMCNSKSRRFLVMRNGDVFDVIDPNTSLGNIGVMTTGDAISPTCDDRFSGILKFNWGGRQIELHTFATGYDMQVIATGFTVGITTPYPVMYICGNRIKLSTWIIQPPTDSSPSIGYAVLRQTVSGCSLVNTLPIQMKVECSREYPAVVYGGNSNYNTGYMYYNAVGSGTFSNINLIPDNENVLDARDARFFVGSGISNTILYVRDTTNSGISDINVIDFNYILSSGQTIGNYRSLYYDTLYTISGGAAYKLETSNNGDTPYIFVAASGVIASGFKFFQKDQEDNYGLPTQFNEYSSTLPQSAITIIRVDDIL